MTVLCAACRHALAKITAREKPTRGIQAIMREVETEYGLPAKSFNQKRRPHEISHPRHVAMYLARQEGHSLSAISRSLDMDHTSILYGCRRVEKKLEAMQ